MAKKVPENVLNITNNQGNANQNHEIITSYLLEWLLLKRRETSVGENVEKGEHSCSVGANVNWCTHYGILYGGYSK